MRVLLRLRMKLLFLLFIVFSSCHKPSPIEPKIAISSLSNITYKQVDYNRFSVRHADSSNFVSEDVVAIAVGIDSAGFQMRDSIPATFDNSTSTYNVNFDATLPFSTYVLELTIRVRYYHFSGSVTEFDTTLSTMKYPYPGTELVWYYSDDLGGRVIEDLDVSDSTLYGQVNDQIVIYDMRSGTWSYVTVYSYEVVTVVNNRYLFYDHYNWSLFRYDLLTSTMERFVYHPPGRFMAGLEYYDNSIYELLYELPGPTTMSFLRYSMSGGLTDSLSLGHPYLNRLAIHNGIAFFQRSSRPGVIWTFDLSSKTFGDRFKSPTFDYEGHRIRDDYFYFSDFEKRAIYRFPFNELFTHGRISPNRSVVEDQGVDTNKYSFAGFIVH
jgi:hypothetical protein